MAENLAAEGRRTQGYKTCPEDAGTEHTVSSRSLAGTDGRWQEMKAVVQVAGMTDHRE